MLVCFEGAELFPYLLFTTNRKNTWKQKTTTLTLHKMTKKQCKYGDYYQKGNIFGFFSNGNQYEYNTKTEMLDNMRVLYLLNGKRKIE